LTAQSSFEDKNIHLVPVRSLFKINLFYNSFLLLLLSPLSTQWNGIL
jgi:hypothetical protein